MESWNKFLDSLATRGGAILLLFLANVGFICLMLYLMGKGYDKSAFAVAIGQTMGNFSGALLIGLKGGDKAPSSTSEKTTTSADGQSETTRMTVGTPTPAAVAGTDKDA